MCLLGRGGGLVTLKLHVLPSGLDLAFATRCLLIFPPPFVTEVSCTVVFGFLRLGFVSFFSYKSHSPGAGKPEDDKEGAGRYVPSLLPRPGLLWVLLGQTQKNVLCTV